MLQKLRASTALCLRRLDAEIARNGAGHQASAIAMERPRKFRLGGW